jgi:cytochrome b
LLIVAAQVVTGLFAVDIDGLESGPLSDRVSFDEGRRFAEIHEISFSILQVLVAVHIAAILFYLYYKRNNLIVPMITGKRPAMGAGMTRAPAGRLMVAIVLAATAMWFLSNGMWF